MRGRERNNRRRGMEWDPVSGKGVVREEETEPHGKLLEIKNMRENIKIQKARGTVDLLVIEVNLLHCYHPPPTTAKVSLHAPTPIILSPNSFSLLYKNNIVGKNKVNQSPQE